MRVFLIPSGGIIQIARSSIESNVYAFLEIDITDQDYEYFTYSLLFFMFFPSKFCLHQWLYCKALYGHVCVLIFLWVYL